MYINIYNIDIFKLLIYLGMEILNFPGIIEIIRVLQHKAQ